MPPILPKLKRILPGFNRRRRERAESRERLLFTSQLVHDVKNLLSVIHASGLMIQQETVCTTAKTYVEHIIKSSEFLNRLLEDILSLNQAELGNLPIKESEVALVEELALVLRPHKIRAQTKQIGFAVRFQGPVPQTLLTDSLRLNQIVTNLVSNAVKFTNRGGVIVEISHAIDRLNVMVRDTGIGIAANERETVFQPYRQVASTGPGEDRHGLGLALARRLARLLGGDVTLVSTAPGAGSTFRASWKAPSTKGAIILEDPLAHFLKRS